MQTRNIENILKKYNKKKLTIATLCSHSSLQIFHGAKTEGFRTIGICIGNIPKFYDAFPKAKPDEFFVLKKIDELLDRAEELRRKNAILIPHGSFVEYLGGRKFSELEIPIFGNRNIVAWEENREKQRELIEGAGLPMPKKINKPEEIDCPVIVKYYGAKGGKGAFIAKNYEEFIEKSPKHEYGIQEYVIGTRYYFQFFYSPIKKDGYKVGDGTIELLGIDRRDEANIDEMYKLGAQEKLREVGIEPTFVVTGNIPVAIRESLLPTAFSMAEKLVERSIKLFGGIIGPFCLETIVTDKLEFKVFEVSTRIVAGTNLFILGSPYSDMIEKELSMGRRIAKEIKLGVKKKLLSKIIS